MSKYSFVQRERLEEVKGQPTGRTRIRVVDLQHTVGSVQQRLRADISNNCDDGNIRSTALRQSRNPIRRMSSVECVLKIPKLLFFFPRQPVISQRHVVGNYVVMILIHSEFYYI